MDKDEASNVPASPRPRIRAARAGVGFLLTTTLVASTGWYLAAREGRGLPPECYALNGDSDIEIRPTHGNATLRATFAVAESPTHVMLGYWEKVAGGDHTMEAYGSVVTYSLVRPLGDRKVVDPAGEAIPAC